MELYKKKYKSYNDDPTLIETRKVIANPAKKSEMHQKSKCMHVQEYLVEDITMEKAPSDEGKELGCLFCHVCGQQFGEALPLREHLDGHFMDRWYECDLCSSRFPGAFLLAQHMSIHQQDSPHVCPHCGKMYQSQHSLMFHLQDKSKEEMENDLVLNLEEPVQDDFGEVDNQVSESSELQEMSYSRGVSGTSSQRHGTTEDSFTDYECLPKEPVLTDSVGVMISARDKENDSSEYNETNDTNTTFLELERSNVSFPQLMPCEDAEKRDIQKASLKNLRGGMKRKTQETDSSESVAAIEMTTSGFACKVCNKTFDTKQKCVRHWRVHTNDTPYSCDYCKRGFKWYSSLSAHLKSHRPDQSGMHASQEVQMSTQSGASHDRSEFSQQHSAFQGEPSYGNSYLELDRTHTTAAAPYTCPHCGQISITEPQYLEHILSHEVVKVHHCQDCGLAFNDSLSFLSHLELHCMGPTVGNGTSKGKSFKCNQCPKSFRNMILLNQHMDEHTSRHTYVCEICDKVFFEDSSYRQHMQLHSAKVKEESDLCDYQCTLCEKRFQSLQELREHAASHSSIQDYQCEKCGKTFKTKSSITRHMYLHYEKGRFKCDNCSRDFKWHSTWNCHLRARESAKDCICTYCNITFCLRSEYNKHMNSHVAKNK